MVAAALARRDDVDHVVGVDASPMAGEAVQAAGVEVVRVDLRSSALVRIFARSAPDIVVHMGVVVSPADGGGRASMKEVNVLGTMHVLAACQKAASLRRVVVRSSAGVYGSGPQDPAIFTEDTEPTRPPRSGWARDCIDVEASVRSFVRRRRDVTVATLRFAHGIGPALRTGFTDLFTLPAVPVPLGRDARLQFVHVDDIVGATVAAALSSVSGEVNVAGDGVISVSAAAGMAGRPVVGLPMPLLRRLDRFPGTGHALDLTDDDLALLSYGRVLDTRRMVRDLGYEAQRTTSEAFADFVAGRRLDGALGRLRAGIDSVVRPAGAAPARTGSR